MALFDHLNIVNNGKTVTTAGVDLSSFPTPDIPVEDYAALGVQEYSQYVPRAPVLITLSHEGDHEVLLCHDWYPFSSGLRVDRIAPSSRDIWPAGTVVAVRVSAQLLQVVAEGHFRPFVHFVRLDGSSTFQITPDMGPLVYLDNWEPTFTFKLSDHLPEDIPAAASGAAKILVIVDSTSGGPFADINTASAGWGVYTDDGLPVVSAGGIEMLEFIYVPNLPFYSGSWVVRKIMNLVES